jgi:ubiquinone/menaquinone biosynthesis C-methylase UbiE
MERLVPSEAPTPILLEHMARYEFAVPLVEGFRVADIACGSGYGSYELAVRGRASSVVGIDISSSAIDYCREHFKADNLEFRVGDATALQLEDESFDFVVSFETIEHLVGTTEYLNELYRVLKPGGSCLISTPNKRMSFANPYHLKEFSLGQFRSATLSRFDCVRLFGQDCLSVKQRLVLSASVMASKAIPERIKKVLVPEKYREEDEERRVGGIIDTRISNCRFFLALCKKS